MTYEFGCCVQCTQVKDLQAQMAAAEKMLSGEKSGNAELKDKMADLKVGSILCLFHSLSAQHTSGCVLLVSTCNESKQASTT